MGAEPGKMVSYQSWDCILLHGKGVGLASSGGAVLRQRFPGWFLTKKSEVGICRPRRRPDDRAVDRWQGFLARSSRQPSRPRAAWSHRVTRRRGLNHSHRGSSTHGELGREARATRQAQTAKVFTAAVNADSARGPSLRPMVSSPRNPLPHTPCLLRPPPILCVATRAGS